MVDNNEWSANVAIVVEGILRAPNDTNPIMSGILLYKSLVQTHRVTLIFDSMAKEKVQYWLRMNNLVDHAGEIYYEVGDPEDVSERRDIQVKRMKQNGPLTFIMESNPEVAEKMLEIGVPTLFYIHPHYMRPEHRPNYEAELPSWKSLMDTVRVEKEMKAGDVRLHDDF